MKCRLLASEHDHPLGLFFVVPEAFRRRVAGGDDPLDADVPVAGKDFGQFLRRQQSAVAESLDSQREVEFVMAFHLEIGVGDELAVATAGEAVSSSTEMDLNNLIVNPLLGSRDGWEWKRGRPPV